MAARKSSKKYGDKASEKVEKAMHERKRGTLKSGSSGKRVTSRKQRIGPHRERIGISERVLVCMRTDVLQRGAAVCERLLELAMLQFDSRQVDPVQPAHAAVASEHCGGLIHRRANVREGLGRTPEAGERKSI